MLSSWIRDFGEVDNSTWQDQLYSFHVDVWVDLKARMADDQDRGEVAVLIEQSMGMVVEKQWADDEPYGLRMNTLVQGASECTAKKNITAKSVAPDGDVVEIIANHRSLTWACMP